MAVGELQQSPYELRNPKIYCVSHSRKSPSASVIEEYHRARVALVQLYTEHSCVLGTEVSHGMNDEQAVILAVKDLKV